jgi:hypothetical protein
MDKFIIQHQLFFTYESYLQCNSAKYYWNYGVAEPQSSTLSSRDSVARFHLPLHNSELTISWADIFQMRLHFIWITHEHTQNNRHSSGDNPHSIYEIPCHNLKPQFCASWLQEGYLSLCFMQRQFTLRDVSQTFQPFFKQLKEEKPLYGHVKNDSAAVHYFNVWYKPSKSMWWKCCKSQFWPPQSPDIAQRDFSTGII